MTRHHVLTALLLAAALVGCSGKGQHGADTSGLEIATPIAAVSHHVPNHASVLSLTIIGDRPVAVWGDGNGIHSAKRRADGTWTDPTTLAPGISRRGQTYSNGRILHLVWTTGGRIYYTQTSDGLTWREPVQLADIPRSSPLTIDGSDDKVRVSWVYFPTIPQSTSYTHAYPPRDGSRTAWCEYDGNTWTYHWPSPPDHRGRRAVFREELPQADTPPPSNDAQADVPPASDDAPVLACKISSLCDRSAKTLIELSDDGGHTWRTYDATDFLGDISETYPDWTDSALAIEGETMHLLYTPCMNHGPRDAQQQLLYARFTVADVEANCPLIHTTVDGLRLNLAAGASPTGDAGETPLSVTLENASQEVRIVPGRFCSMVRWQMFVRLYVRTADGQVFRPDYEQMAIADVRSVHGHGPLAVPPGESVGGTAVLTVTALLDLAEVPQELRRASELEIWAAFEARATGGEAYCPDFRPGAVYVPPAMSLSEGQPTLESFLKQFEDGKWPSWAWRGKLTSNIVRITLDPDECARGTR